jgi:hypothetical protein
MPTRVYPDTNIIHLLGSAWTPSEFDRRAAANDLVLALGLHAMYELARGFLYPPHIETVRRAFEYLGQIERVEYLPSVNEMLRAEFDHARLGVPIITVIGRMNQVSTKLEIARLARGYSDRAAEFIARREAGVVAIHHGSALANIRQLARLRREKTFEDFRRRVAPATRALVLDLARSHSVRHPEVLVERILGTPSRFPAVSTWLSVQLYLSFVAVVHGTPPALDKRDDFRHLVESPQCGYFVTNDAQLLGYAKRLSAYRPSVSWDEFARRLS